MSHRRSVFVALLVVAAAVATPASAQLPPGSGSPVTIDGNKASVTLGAGGVSVDVSITFEQVVGLTAANLGISARLVSPAELVGRLPDATLTSLPAGFPLLVSVEPPSSGGLSFSGLTSIELHTHDLSFLADSPLRLFKAPAGGAFADVTESIGMGSYRARGSTGGFSELLIIADLRGDADVVEAKLDLLDATFAAGSSSIAPAVRGDLQSSLLAIRAAWDSGDVRGAIAAATSFGDAVKAAANAGNVPNVWRSARDLQNVAGNLRADAGTLRFSLALAE